MTLSLTLRHVNTDWTSRTVDILDILDRTTSYITENLGTIEMSLKIPSANGRNGAGQFTIGNKYGKGNPHASKVAALRSAALDSISPATAKKLVKSLVSQAMAGDTGAAKIILPYLIGQPATSKDLENEIAAKPATLENMTDEQLQAIVQGKYISGQEYVFNVVETMIGSNRQ